MATDPANDKHFLEDEKSWKFFQQRTRDQQEKQNVLQMMDADGADDDAADSRQRNQRRLKSKKKKIIPKPDDDTFHAMMIDAGSQGTRIHLYEFEQRILYNENEINHALNGFKLSLPTTNSRWTNKYKPGLDSLASIIEQDDLMEAVEDYLKPLFQFAKAVLAEKEEDWERYPIYLKATGGLRTLPTRDRIRIIDAIRRVFRDSDYNPFNFEDERCRVISGEEEAIYGWTAVNYIKGTLVHESEGAGTVLNPKLTYGMVEMGGASTQIGFFEPNGDIMSNLFKLKIGGARHWNVYVHSFLYFGVNGAWSRLNARLYQESTFRLMEQNETHFINPCLPMGSSITYSSWIHSAPDGYLLPRSNPQSITYHTTMYNEQMDFEVCSDKARKLLRKEANLEWADFSHDSDASFAGIYQPPLPINETEIGGFIATSNFADIWEFLDLDETSPIHSVKEKGEKICKMTLEELTEYNNNLKRGSVNDEEELAQMCFRSVFVFEMLTTGYGFPTDYEITAVDTLNGYKLGWSLGSVLYEVNSLPWEIANSVKVKGSKKHGKSEYDSDKSASSSFDFDTSAISKAGLSSGSLGRGRSFGSHHHAAGMAVVICLAAIFVARVRIFHRKRYHERGYRSIPGSTDIILSER